MEGSQMTIHYRKSSNYYTNICGNNSDEWRTTHTNVNCSGCLEKVLEARKADVVIIQNKLKDIKSEFLNTHIGAVVRRPHRPSVPADVVNANTTESVHDELTTVSSIGLI